MEKLRADCQENIESYSVPFNLSNSLVHPQYESVGLPFCATISELSYIVFVVRSAQFSEIIVVVFFFHFQGVADEYNRLKDLKRVSGFQWNRNGKLKE